VLQHTVFPRGVLKHTLHLRKEIGAVILSVMPEYRRAVAPGGSFFFTVVTDGRRPLFEQARCREILRVAIGDCRARRPFELDGIVLLLDHFHLMFTLPDGDANFSIRMAAIKANFTRQYLAQGGSEFSQTPSRRKHRYRGVWQKRYWEHVIRDDNDFARHLDYLHFNPVKHGLAVCPHAWPHSTFDQWVKKRVYESDWLCSCGGRRPIVPNFDDLAGVEMDE
jgi:putative transposase